MTRTMRLASLLAAWPSWPRPVGRGGNAAAAEEPAASQAAGSEAAAPSAAAFPEGDVEIELWTKEGDPQIEYVEALADAYTAEHPNVTIRSSTRTSKSSARTS